MKKIPFSPPDITQQEIDEVIDALKSGWITTGPKTKLFENMLNEFCGTKKTVCLNSQTACAEMTLRLLGVGPGDEVIVPAYTYTASCSVILHVGATPIIIDSQKDNVEMDYEKLKNAINEKTKVIIPVDVGGVVCDYDKIFEIVNEKKYLFKANNDIQKAFNRIIVMADTAHSLGAEYKGKKTGNIADFSCFSFHAVKNLTTAEGGAVTWKPIEGIDNEYIYKQYQLLSLHGQTKDALSKLKVGAWEYDIVGPFYKCNMTDIMASIGIAQLKRYPEMIKRRHDIIKKYTESFKKIPVICNVHETDSMFSSGHLFLVRINGADENLRNKVIEKMADLGIACNVHYKPLPMFTAYKKLGFDIKDYPNAFNLYKNEITLPLNTCLTDDDVDYIIQCFEKVIRDETME